MQHSGENLEHSYKAFINSYILSTDGVSRNRALRASSNSSGFSSMYFSSLKKYKSEPLGTSLPDC